MAIFYIQYEATPDRNSEDFQTCGGAFVNCWVRADSEIEAQKLTSDAIREDGWTILAVEEECREVNEHWYSENDEGREYYEQCVTDGECYVFNMWSVEPQEQDDVH